MDIKVENIKSNLDCIQTRIRLCAESCGRKPQEIKLITVTKAQPKEVVEAAIHAGADRLGENYPVEAVEKIKALKEYKKVEWHMIGHVQSRKSALIAEHFDFFHSLDSVKLAKKINEKLEEKENTLPVLLEVNVSGEESKFGWAAWNESLFPRLFSDIEILLKLSNLKICGLMTMPPYFTDAEKVRPFFRKMSDLMSLLSFRFPETDWKELSMGTSIDFETAIQEGATFVRVGTAIVGPREYQKKPER